ncbi:MAG: hypothetical protein CVV04_08090 [Firmicutes bacterium HGW-Firmicutes-9]|jgi:uncharacterized membrane protein|nr:MAG: hypothetical protein CVV04_08090 [Firmicutes bacterium HGW-Firmicutes-9]
MNWKNIDQRQVITILLCTVGTFILSILRVQVDATTSAIGAMNSYASLQDVGIIASVMALGSPWGIVAPVVGIVIGDIVMGSKNFIIGNIIIRSLMALFALAFSAKVDNWKKSFVVAGLMEGIMLVLFLVYDFVIIREFAIVGITLLLQLAQAVVCTLVGAVVLRYMPVMEPDKMLDIRRTLS